MLEDWSATINGLAKAVCSKIKRFEGLSFNFEINAQKYEVPDDDALRIMLFYVVKVFITMPQNLFSE